MKTKTKLNICLITNAAFLSCLMKLISKHVESNGVDFLLS